MKEEITFVRRLLGAVESLVPDHVIEDALRKFRPSTAVHFIRLALAGPRKEFVWKITE